jgi:hypothetical protein
LSRSATRADELPDLCGCEVPGLDSKPHDLFDESIECLRCALQFRGQDGGRWTRAKLIDRHEHVGTTGNKPNSHLTFGKIERQNLLNCIW